MKFRIEFDSERGWESVHAYDADTGEEVDLNRLVLDGSVGVAYAVLIDSEKTPGGPRIMLGETCYPRRAGPTVTRP